MPAISLTTRGEVLHQLAKRDNWASNNVGVVLVFCIVFIVFVGLISLVVYRRMMARRARNLGTA
ncbi:hypothetical protein AJ80_09584 [Polytolypa hystricis UAMH7299]|uniref:Uncharacterized protein n=1 Tax=Polytolypa hystricis (strain UAMH7299) TaxID=1447883 RepID=A0A2B7WNB1_POLH7|nr:hypothetical protein AJ80_09584 [Polytolypa hystricis UAMH7299]